MKGGEKDESVYGTRGDFVELDPGSTSRPLPVVRIDGPYGAPAEERPSCIALVEWPQPGNPPYLNWIDLLSVFASSPDKNRTGQFLGQVNPFVWGMPTWDMYELRRG